MDALQFLSQLFEKHGIGGASSILVFLFVGYFITKSFLQFIKQVDSFQAIAKEHSSCITKMSGDFMAVVQKTNDAHNNLARAHTETSNNFLKAMNDLHRSHIVLADNHQNLASSFENMFALNQIEHKKILDNLPEKKLDKIASKRAQ